MKRVECWLKGGRRLQLCGVPSCHTHNTHTHTHTQPWMQIQSYSLNILAFVSIESILIMLLELFKNPQFKNKIKIKEKYLEKYKIKVFSNSRC